MCVVIQLLLALGTTGWLSGLKAIKQKNKARIYIVFCNFEVVSYIYSAIALLNVSCYMCLHVLKPALLQNNAAPAVFTSLAAATAACSMPCPSPGRLPRL